MKRVLIVCKGNICRSPTAAVVLETKARNHGLNIFIDSAGVENYHVGDPPDPRSIHHAAKRGYDLSKKSARQIQKSDFLAFDFIWVADEENLIAVRRLCPPPHQQKLSLFLIDTPLPDPYYGGSEGFDLVLDLIEKRVDSIIQEWKSTN